MNIGMVKGKIVFDFPNLGRTLVLNSRELSGEIRQKALLHGLKQKCIAAMALEQGRGMEDLAKFEAVRGIIERLTNGKWGE